MAVTIDNDTKKISMTRGDSLLLHVAVLLKNQEYVTEYRPKEGDSVRFALKHSTLRKDKSDFEDEEPLILRDIPIDTMLLELKPEDTKNLGFGKKYTYDIQITFASGHVDTFIADAPFELTKEVA